MNRVELPAEAGRGRDSANPAESDSSATPAA